MKKFPNKVIYKKPHKIKNRKGSKGINLSRYTTGLKTLSSCYFSYEQLEASRRIISRLTKPKEIKNKKNLKVMQSVRKASSKNKRSKSKRKKKKPLLIRSNLCLPLTKKPLQVRMGKGKGSVDTWVYNASRSRILFEISRQQFKLSKIKTLFTKSSVKLPVKTKLLFQRNKCRREFYFKNYR